MVFAGLEAPPPTRRHLRHWEQVCCFLDSQPRRAVAHPFPMGPTLPLLSTRLLKRMAAFKLVSHYDDCTWRLNRRWRARLARLAEGLPPDEPRERRKRDAEGEADPFIADVGVDTLYVSLYGDEVPTALLEACDYYKDLAQEDDATIETEWLFFDAPLSMYKHGVGTGKGNRVSWSFLLRNEYLQLLLRRTPLQGMFGSVRFSAQCLWTFGPRGTLDRFASDLDVLWQAMAGGRVFRQMYGPDGDAAEAQTQDREDEAISAVRFQLSQIHLCADIAHFAPEPSDLARVVSRSFKKAVHIPSIMEQNTPDPSRFADDGDDEDADFGAFLLSEPWEVESVPPEWEGVPVDFYADGEEDDENKASTDKTEDENEGDETPADEEGAAAYLWGQRASGFAFSPGADLSATWYDKALEERLSGKLWMRPIHEAGGWQVGMPLFRVEVRFRRGVLRELASAYGQDARTVARWFDDPWLCLDHLGDLWAYFVGLPPELDSAPDVVGRGWMRLTLPNLDDTNHSRWPTDPTWETIQRAQFVADLPTALKRLPKVAPNLNQVDAELYGLLKLRAALRGEYLSEQTTLSQELHRFVERMEEVDAERGRDFAEEVREKARSMGKPVPLRQDRALLLRRPSGRTAD